MLQTETETETAGGEPGHETANLAEGPEKAAAEGPETAAAGATGADAAPETAAAGATGADAAPEPNRERRNSYIPDADQGRLLIPLAKGVGANLTPRDEMNARWQGICPFHRSQGRQPTRTLEISVDDNFFGCRTCGVRGDAAAFAARIWGMAIMEARQWLQDPENARGARPAAILYDHSPTYHEPPRPQNTALLTRAALWFEERLVEPAAVSYLTRLDLTIEQAAAAGIGYCSGYGLRGYLLRQDLTPEEIDQSPLFRGAGRRERMSGYLTVAELDHAGGVMSFTGVARQELNARRQWPAQAPNWTALPGQRPALLGRMNLPPRPAKLVITDDPRLFLILRAAGPAEDLAGVMPLRPNPARIIDQIARLSPRQVAVACRDGKVAGELMHALQERLPAAPSVVNGEWINNCLNGYPRNFEALWA